MLPYIAIRISGRFVLAAGFIGALAFAQFTLASQAQDERTFATLAVNGRNSGESIVILRLPDVLVKTTVLVQNDLHGITGTRTRIGEDEYVSLASLAPGISYQFDARTLSLVIQADPRLLATHEVNLAAPTPASIQYRSDPNVFLNYTVSTATRSHFSGFFENGVNTANLLVENTASLHDGRLRRGLSYVERDNAPKMRKFVLGDDLVNVGDLQGSAQLAGVVSERQFDFDPYFVRFPLPALRAAVPTPSTADVYVNGMLVRHVDIAPGPFDLQNIPVANGPNVTTVVVKDAFGRSVDYRQLYYANTGLLRKGLSDFSYAAGALRTGLLTQNDRYGNAELLARYALGVTDYLTVGGALEAGGSGLNLGITVNKGFPTGYLHFTAAGSRAAGQNGAALSASYAQTTSRRSLGVSMTATSAAYAAAMLRPQDDRTVLDLSGFAGVPMGRKSGLAVSLGRSVDRDAGPSTYASLQTSAQLSARTVLTLTASRTIHPGNAETTVFANLSFALGPHSSSAISAQSNGSQTQTQLDVQRYPEIGPGFGYDLRFNQGQRSILNGQLSYRSAVGEANLAFGQPLGSTLGAQISIAGGMASFGHGLYFSRPLADGFGAVDIPGSSHVRVLVENEYLGRTDRHGRLLLPRLLPNYGNRVGLSTLDAPLNFAVRSDDQLVAPRRKSGLIVHFDAGFVHAYVGSFIVSDRGRSRVPAYGAATLTGLARSYRSDLDAQGHFYFEDLLPGAYDATIEFARGVCRTRVNVGPSTDLQTELGIIPCA